MKYPLNLEDWGNLTPPTKEQIEQLINRAKKLGQRASIYRDNKIIDFLFRRATK